MARPRTCPECQTATPIEKGYNFDGEGNLLCPSCGKVLYPVTVAAEQAIDTGLRARSQTSYGYNAQSGKYDAWNKDTSYRPPATSYAESHRGVQYPGAVDDDDVA